MSDKEKLRIAIEALEKIAYEDGPGLDLSPPGPFYDIAKKALKKIKYAELYS